MINSVVSIRKGETLNTMHGRNGFSSIELIAVIGVIGIFSAIATPTLFTMLHKKRVDQAARQIAWDLKRARSAAIRYREDCVVNFSNGGTYTADLQNTGRNIINVNLKERYPGMEFNCRGDDGILTVTPADNVTFTPTRTADNGSIYIMPSSHVSINKTNNMRKISIYKSGKIKTEKYKTGSCDIDNSWE